MFENEKVEERLILVAAYTGTEEAANESLDELEELVETAGAITVEIPEATRSGVRSVVFAMVVESDISTSIDEIDATDIPQRKVEKILHEGNVYIHIQMPDGTDEWYDLSGRPVVLPMR